MTVTHFEKLRDISASSARRFDIPARESYNPAMTDFRWEDPGELVDRDLMLALWERHPADAVKGYVPTYRFELHRTGSYEKIGYIDLRGIRDRHPISGSFGTSRQIPPAHLTRAARIL